MPQFQYIDLFDDELYQHNTIANAPANSELLNTIRLQVMLAILFNRKLVVPEQWALSSASFLEIADEVIEGYSREITLREKRGKISKRVITPPIVVSYFDRPNATNDHYASALIERIDTHRRLKFCGSVSDPHSESYNNKRQALKDLFGHEINIADAQKRYSDQFTDNLLTIIDDDQTAIRLSNLTRYLVKNKQANIHFDSTVYHQTLAKYAANVKKVCFEDEMLSVYHDPRIEEFRSFFLRAEKEKIPLGEISKLWSMSENFTRSSYSLITKMGQYCLHRALSDNSKANYGSSFYSAFGLSTDGFEEVIIDRMRRIEVSSQQQSLANRDFYFLAGQNAAHYDLADRLYWPEIWREAAAFSVSEGWQKCVKKLQLRLNKMSLEKIHESDTWLEVFDYINSQITGFAFSRSKSSSQSFILAAKTGDVATAAKAASAIAPTVLGSFSMLAAFASVAIKYTSFEYELKATRKYRQGVEKYRSAKQVFSNRGLHT